MNEYIENGLQQSSQVSYYDGEYWYVVSPSIFNGSRFMVQRLGTIDEDKIRVHVGSLRECMDHIKRLRANEVEKVRA